MFLFVLYAYSDSFFVVSFFVCSSLLLFIYSSTHVRGRRRTGMYESESVSVTIVNKLNFIFIFQRREKKRREGPIVVRGMDA